MNGNKIISYLLLLFSLLVFVQVDLLAQKKNFTVVIDPGHGGRDPGALGASSKEKDIVLAVGKKVGELIASKHNDVNVLYTRDKDLFVALGKRAEIANKAKADLFISIHCNALDRRRASPRGVETYVLGLHRSKDNLDVAKAENAVILYEPDYSTRYQGFDPNEPESYIMFEFMTDQYLQQSVSFATLVQNRLVNNSKLTNRSVRQAGFLVLREVAMPSVLVELGYISNAEDERYMRSSKGQNSMAMSIYMAFSDYKQEYDKKNNAVFEDQDHQMKSNSKAKETAGGRRVYKVQFLTSSQKLSLESRQLKGLTSVDYYYDNGLYKYTYGESASLQEIKVIHAELKKKFNDAFIVQFENDKRVK